jgi:hypothetical protein
MGSGTSDLDDVPHDSLGSFDIIGLSGKLERFESLITFWLPLCVTFGLDSPARAFPEGAF